MIIERQVRIVKYWIKLNSNESGNIILRTVYMKMVDDMSRGAITLLSKVKNLLESNGFAEIWMYPESVFSNNSIPVLRQRLVDTHISNWREGMETGSSLSLFRNLKTSYQPAPYLYKVLNRKYKNAIAKLRLSSHPLLIIMDDIRVFRKKIESVITVNSMTLRTNTISFSNVVNIN